MRGQADSPDVGLELLISALLRAGIAISLTLIVAGTVVSFIHHPDYTRSAEALSRLTRPGMAPRDLRDVAAGLAALRGQALVMLGLLVLMATPVLRVAVSLVSFLRSHDRAFALLTSAVLLLLLLSLLLGKAGG
jgi:uncharacterized membrane protein